jgi:hypothetical protein
LSCLVSVSVAGSSSSASATDQSAEFVGGFDIDRAPAEMDASEAFADAEQCPQAVPGWGEMRIEHLIYPDADAFTPYGTAMLSFYGVDQNFRASRGASTISTIRRV